MNERTIFFNFRKCGAHGGMILTGKKPKESEKNLSQCHFVHHKFHWIDPGHCSERLVTNHLSHGTAYLASLLMHGFTRAFQERIREVKI
jgi:hypothetical protein